MAYAKETKRQKINNIIALMQRGCSRREACIHVKVPPTTVQNWIQKSKKIAEEFESAEIYLDVVAEKVMAEDIIDKKNVETAKWYLERKKKNKYSTRSEHTGEEGSPLFKGAQIVINRAEKPKEDGKPTETQS